MDISLDVPRGQLLTLLGPSGCGKTTLLRIIAGLLPADQGQVWLDGQDSTYVAARARRVGFVFQNYALFGHMTVADNVDFGLRVLKRRERPSQQARQDRVYKLLEMVQLRGLAERYPHQLSGGQQQRVAIARALAPNPRLLLLDEPFGALDAKVRRELRSELRNVQHQLGMTCILVTHDQEEAREVSDHIVLMNQGRIEQQGTPSHLFARPRSAFAQDFLRPGLAGEAVATIRSEL